MVVLHASIPQNLNCKYRGRGGCPKFELGCAKLYEMCIKLWHHFFRNSKLCASSHPNLNYEYGRGGGGKWGLQNLSWIVQNVYKIMARLLFWNSKMVGLHASALQNLNCEYWWRVGCTKFEFGCKNCTKCVQNYGTIFILKFENGGAYMPPHAHPKKKFELRVPVKGRLYKIWAQLYNILRNVSKIMASFFSKFEDGEAMCLHPP